MFRARPLFSFKVIVQSLAQNQKKAYALIFAWTEFMTETLHLQFGPLITFHLGLADNDQCHNSGLITLTVRFNNIDKPHKPENDNEKKSLTTSIHSSGVNPKSTF